MMLDNLTVPLVLPFGWTISRAHPIHGPIVVVFPGDGVAPTPPASIVSYRIPPGMRYMVTGFVAKEIGYAEYGQVGCFLAFNGIQAVEGYATRRCDGVEVPIYRDFGMGLLEISGINISGTTSGAPEGISAEVRGSILGFLLRPKKRGER